MDLASLHRAHVESLQRGVAAALEKTGFGALAIHSGSPVKRTEADDAYWSLRPTPHFQHWLPLAEPGGLLVVQPGKQPKLVRTPKPLTRTSSRWASTPRRSTTSATKSARRRRSRSCSMPEPLSPATAPTSPAPG